MADQFAPEFVGICAYAALVFSGLAFSHSQLRHSQGLADLARAGVALEQRVFAIHLRVEKLERGE